MERPLPQALLVLWAGVKTSADIDSVFPEPLTENGKAGHVAQLLGAHLVCTKHWVGSLAAHKLRVVRYTCHSSPWEVEVGGPEV